jgi:hypothetical protein
MRDEGKNRTGLEGFRSDGPLDQILPGPILASAVIAAAEEGDLSGMSLNALTGLLRGTQKAEALLAWCRRRAEAEYVRRGEAWDPSLGEEVVDDCAVQDAAQELLLTGGAVQRKLRMSRQSTRLTECMRLLHDGKLRDDWRMTIIEQVTENVSDENIARIDKMIAERAGSLTPIRLRNLCVKIVMAIEPTALAENTKQARKRRRVEIRQEDSGNGWIALREAAVPQTMAVKANLERWARAMRKAGHKGSLDNLRHDAAIALLTGANPLPGNPEPSDQQVPERQAPGEGPWSGTEPADQDPAEAAEDPDAAFYDPWSFPPDDQAGAVGTEEESGEDGGDDRENGGSGGRAQAPEAAPLASIHLIASLNSVFGLSGVPSELAGFGLVDATDTRNLIRDAARNPGTRFCVTLTDADGTAVAHACARGPHPWQPPATGPPGPTAAKIATMREFVESLGLTFTPIARERGDPVKTEPRHDPSRALSHLIRARNATCASPGCGASAATADLDHVVAYESGGSTSEDNLDPRHRHCHLVKHRPQWKVEVVKPGITRWTGPSGRSRIVYPTSYLL